ncbi:uncharacterized protein LOC141648051 isoform X1 [Silene latifolia]|uniref:uncharacterized protein LOC141648051 isoform X1 n=1 Tax=Silene latifolia TaxID=37657 RepID=UPI003D784D85
MSVAYSFSKEEMAIDPSLGYPRAYAKLCKDTSITPYTNGPPFTFTPYTLHSNEGSRAKELEEMFPIIDQEGKPTAKTRIFISILWKQLNHLGNAGFDPAMFRVDPYGNVLYFHADSASPLAWAIDHWFPCSRGGLTVPSNLRILQWQVCKRKQKQLEFLVPWWDLQLGISINQFLSIFASVNSDFRHRAFRWLFSAGENEELNDLQTVDSHNFPQPFIKSKDQLGLAPAAVVRSRKDSADASSSTLRSLDFNRQSRPNTPTIIAAAKKYKDSGLKENEMPDMVTNPYQAIVMARDSLKQREESNKMKMEIQRLDDEVNEFKLKNEEEKMTIQELELALIKRRRRAEKCRKLAEAQSAHRAMLQKMINNAMHQSVVYKEQVRLNQAATNTLMARLEAQIALSNSAEKELYLKFKQRDELEKQIRPKLEPARKRSRTEDDAFLEEKEDRTLIYLPRIKSTKHLHKELRAFLEEEQKLSEAALSMIEEEENTEKLGIVERHDERENAGLNISFPFSKDNQVEEDEELRKKRGKSNVEKWMQMLLENTEGEEDLSPLKLAETPGTSSKTDEIIKMLNEKYPQKDIKVLRLPSSTPKHHENDLKNEKSEIEPRNPRSMSTPRRSISCETDIIGKGGEVRKSFGGGKEIFDKNGKGKGIARCESARSLRHFPSSPSKILNMSKGVDCLRKKPLVFDDEDEYRDENRAPGHNILKSPFKNIKKAVKR